MSIEGMHLSRIVELEGQLAEAWLEIKRLHEAMARLNLVLDEKRAGAREARKDTARLDWLAENGSEAIYVPPDDDTPEEWQAVARHTNRIHFKDTLREAIDAAREGEG